MRKPTGAGRGSTTSCAKLYAIQFISQDADNRARAFFTISSFRDRFPGGSSSITFRNVRTIDRDPPLTADEDLGPTMLCFCDVFRRRTQALVAQDRFGNADVGYVARSETPRAGTSSRTTAGRFNDFAEIALLRSALLKACSATKRDGLTHEVPPYRVGDRV
jgi:hypothetical protein